MRYNAAKKFAELTINPHHQNLERSEFLALKRGKTVEIPNPPAKLIDGDYLIKVGKKESN